MGYSMESVCFWMDVLSAQELDGIIWSDINIKVGSSAITYRNVASKFS